MKRKNSLLRANTTYRPKFKAKKGCFIYPDSKIKAWWDLFMTL